MHTSDKESQQHLESRRGTTATVSLKIVFFLFLFVNNVSSNIKYVVQKPFIHIEINVIPFRRKPYRQEEITNTVNRQSVAKC